MTEETIKQRIETLRGQYAQLLQHRAHHAQQVQQADASLLKHEGAIIEFEALLKAEVKEEAAPAEEFEEQIKV